MIKIYPTTASGLSYSDYSLSIRPRNEEPSLKSERLQSTSITLSGETVVSVWAKKVSGTVFTIEAVLSESEYAILRMIDEHATVFEWVIVLQGRTFNASVDVIRAIPVLKNNKDGWQTNIKFTIISELHR